MPDKRTHEELMAEEYKKRVAIDVTSVRMTVVANDLEGNEVTLVDRAGLKPMLFKSGKCGWNIPGVRFDLPATEGTGGFGSSNERVIGTGNLVVIGSDKWPE